MNGSLLHWPTAEFWDASRWRRLCNSEGVNDDCKRDENSALIALQWLVAIATSYLVIAAQDLETLAPMPALLILLCLSSAVLLRRVPKAYYEKHLIAPGLLVVNSILIVSAIATSQVVPWDLLILFFFCVFIAAIGDNLIQVGVLCVLLSLVFVVFVSPTAVDPSAIRTNFLFRIPFMFGISLFYGHLASQVKLEKKRTEKIEEEARLKRQVLCALAHDIKTPLNVIQGYAELLAEPHSGYSNSRESASYLNCIRQNINRIAKMITDFLDVSKLESLKSEGGNDSIQLNAIAEDVVLEQMVTARAKNLRLALELDENLEPVLGDFTQMQRALSNLVSNAIKFTPSGGSITVKSQRINKSVTIEVKDTGVGIPMEEMSGLFSEFHRLRSEVNTEGTGLGLFIVKSIVENHGGNVSVQSEVGQGSTFTIRLPTAPKKAWESPRRAA
jgi:signal transduction histidine kinase